MLNNVFEKIADPMHGFALTKFNFVCKVLKMSSSLQLSFRLNQVTLKHSTVNDGFFSFKIMN